MILAHVAVYEFYMIISFIRSERVKDQLDNKLVGNYLKKDLLILTI